MSFHVVCVDDGDVGDGIWTTFPSGLENGCVYTVVSVSRESAMYRGTFRSEPGYVLAEVENPFDVLVPDEPPVGFCSARFRPLSETRLDIFHSILTDAPKREDVPA